MMLGAGLQNHFGATDVGDQGAQRIFEDVLDAYRRGEVIDQITLSHQSIDQRRVRDAAFEESELGMALERAKVLEAAGGEVIQCPNFGALLQQQGLRKMGP